MMVDRALARLEKDYPGLEVERIDIITNPRRALKNGIRMIPALKAGKEILSGIFLSSREIKDFVAKTEKQ